MARYYGGICINHTVLKRISSKKIFRTVVPPPWGRGEGTHEKGGSLFHGNRGVGAGIHPTIKIAATWSAT